MLPSLLRKVRKADPYDPESRSYFAIMIADYKTKVRVLGVTKVKRRQDTITECPYFVTAEVLDKVKGQQLPLFPTDSLGRQIIQFRYDGSLYSSNWIENVKDIYKNDPLLKVGEDEFGLKVGQEIIAFMRFNTFKCDYDYDYYPLELDYACSNSALPVVNGVVSDVNKIWLPSTNYSYSEWKARFTELVNRIKNGTY
ncbi:MAG: hypothetical protein IPP08_11320 [Chlorobiota bacterium]|nr:MAG: hypothetical protein IPP08_11320 [Chlorobiota bacterium]